MDLVLRSKAKFNSAEAGQASRLGLLAIGKQAGRAGQQEVV